MGLLKIGQEEIVVSLGEDMCKFMNYHFLSVLLRKTDIVPVSK